MSEFSDIDCFRQVYLARSYSKAAPLIPMTPQGLSRKIKCLEREFDVELFTFDGSVLTPTAYADRLMEFAERLSELQQNLVDDFDLIKNNERIIKLRVSNALMPMLVYRWPELFLDSLPFSVRLKARNTQRVEDELCASTDVLGFIPVSISYSKSSADLSLSCFLEPVFEMQQCILVAKDHPLAERDFIIPQDIANEHILLENGKNRGREWFLDLLRERNVTPASVAYTSDVRSQIEFVAEGRGISINSRECLSPAELNRIAAVPIKGAIVSCSIVWNKDHILTPTERNFIECVKSTLNR